MQKSRSIADAKLRLVDLGGGRKPSHCSWLAPEGPCSFASPPYDGFAEYAVVNGGPRLVSRRSHAIYPST